MNPDTSVAPAAALEACATINQAVDLAEQAVDAVHRLPDHLRLIALAVDAADRAATTVKRLESSAPGENGLHHDPSLEALFALGRAAETARFATHALGDLTALLAAVGEASAGVTAAASVLEGLPRAFRRLPSPAASIG